VQTIRTRERTDCTNSFYRHQLTGTRFAQKARPPVTGAGPSGGGPVAPPGPGPAGPGGFGAAAPRGAAPGGAHRPPPTRPAPPPGGPGLLREARPRQLVAVE
jgi:hypothetical protein